jgi:hypothetical protein
MATHTSNNSSFDCEAATMLLPPRRPREKSDSSPQPLQPHITPEEFVKGVAMTLVYEMEKRISTRLDDLEKRLERVEIKVAKKL